MAVAKKLVQARVKAATKQKLARLAAAGDRKLAAYIAIVLEDHARGMSVKTMKMIAKAWRGVEEDRNSVVRAKDGPRR